MGISGQMHSLLKNQNIDNYIFVKKGLLKNYIFSYSNYNEAIINAQL